MAENPLRKLARLAGGVVLTHGRLGHQVLGQLLISDSGDVAVAGATVALAATSRQRSAVAQAALRTGLPTLALRAYYQRRERRLVRRGELVEEARESLKRERERLAEAEARVASRADAELAAAAAQLEAERASAAVLRADKQALEAELAAARERAAAFERQVEELRRELAARPPAPPPPAPGRGGRRRGGPR